MIELLKSYHNKQIRTVARFLESAYDKPLLSANA
jgi:hypothetical protein